MCAHERPGAGWSGRCVCRWHGLLVAPLVFRVPRVLSCGPGCFVCPWAVARPLAVRAASFARRVDSLSGQAPPPPTGTAARQRRGLSLWLRRGCMKERSPLRSAGRSFGVPL